MLPPRAATTTGSARGRSVARMARDGVDHCRVAAGRRRGTGALAGQGWSLVRPTLAEALGQCIADAGQRHLL